MIVSIPSYALGIKLNQTDDFAQTPKAFNLNKSSDYIEKRNQMKISTRGRYALKMMVEFAINSDTPTKINQVSKSYGISEKYLEQIVSILSKAKLVKSIRGAQGGYLLIKPVEEYTVGEILRLTEGSLSPVDCLDGNGSCVHSDFCVTQNLFKKVEDDINNVVDNISLQDLVDDELDIRKREKELELIDKNGCHKIT